jgi:hypothetical protein
LPPLPPPPLLLLLCRYRFASLKVAKDSDTYKQLAELTLELMRRGKVGSNNSNTTTACAAEACCPWLNTPLPEPHPCGLAYS